MKKMQLAAIILVSAVAAGRLHADTTFNPSPSRIVGQPQLTLLTSAPNLVEGREFNAPQGVAADTSVTPPILYVVDTGNNRVLAWRNAAGFANGAFADLVIGQSSKYATAAWGPGTSVSTGLNSPTGAAVDGKGNLYVVDSGNNRILRYPKPFDQPADALLPDMVAGQKTFSASSSNQGLALPTAKTLSLNLGGSNVYRSGLAFDKDGNLYASDPGNHRVLRYPAALLDLGSNEPAADVVLGQSTFDSKTAQIPTGDRNTKTGLATPSGLALDQTGRLFVCDLLNRVLVYLPPFTNGKSAARVMGVAPQASGQPYPINDTSLGAVSGSSYLPPEGVFTIGNLSFVIDTYNSRILRFPSYDTWPAETSTVISPAASGVIAQVDYGSRSANRGLTEPAAFTLAGPIAGVFAGGMLFVADPGNHRVLVYSDPSSSSDLPSFGAQRVLGQDGFRFNAVNLIEGREFRFNSAGAIAVDSSSDPPRLYVADTGNHRILAFKDARKVRPGQKADLVIGQGSDDSRFQRALVNYPSGEPTTPNQSGLNAPIGIAVDAEGNLWVADYGNGRVLRFPRPFDKQQQAADIVLGQTSFFSQLTDATIRTMFRPFGLAFSNDGHLAVSDLAHNRILLFQRDATTGFQNGQSAWKIYGQNDSTGSTSGSAATKLNAPRGIAIDAGDRLYASDTSNGRVSIFGPIYQQPQYGAAAADSIKNLSSPQGVHVSRLTGAIWIVEPGSTQARRWPDYDKLLTSGYASNAFVYAAYPTAVTMDGFGNLLVAESTNRVDFFFPWLSVTNAASYRTRVTPGMIASLWPAGNSYGDQTKNFNELENPLPLPTTLADLQVLVGDSPAPLFFVSPGQINFQVPSTISDSGIVEVQVVRPSKDQILGAATVGVEMASPGMFTNDGSGGGQIAALNQDNSRNSSSIPAQKNQVIQLFGTGPGLVPNSPADGTLVSGLVPTDIKPQVWMESSYVAPENVEYSGLAPGLVGVWQINVKIPDKLAPLVPNQVPVFIEYRSRRSLEQGMKVTTIAVKP
jgi:uncharacterized protein (TIGR03437 family)